MSKQVNELLAGLTEEELAAYTSEPAEEAHIVISSDRSVKVPESLKRIAMQYDHDIETVTFDCPKTWDGNDLSEMPIYINYVRADGKVGSYLAQNVVVDGDIMHFDWTISRHVTSAHGQIAFLVCARNTDTTTGNIVNAWHSELNSEMHVSKGIECQDVVTETYPDIITQLLLRMEYFENGASSTLSSAQTYAKRAENASANAQAVAKDMSATMAVADKLEEEIDIERKRINNLATLKVGSTTGDAELADIRVGYDGKTYPNAGDAVRGQIHDIEVTKVDEKELENYDYILNESGMTSYESVTGMSTVIDVPERSGKYARLNSFGGISRKVVVHGADGNNIIPFPYAENNFGTDGHGWIATDNEQGATATFISSNNKLVIDKNGPYKFKVWYEYGGSPYVSIGYVRNGETVNTYGLLGGGRLSGDIQPKVETIVDDNNRVIAYEVILDLLNKDEVTLFSVSDDSGMEDSSISAGGAVYEGWETSDIDPDTGETVWYKFFYEDSEWVPRVAHYRFANTKLKAIKSVNSNDEVVHIYTIPSDIPAVDGFVDSDDNVYSDIIDIRSQSKTTNIGVKVLDGSDDEQWAPYGTSMTTRPEGAYAYYTIIDDRKLGLSNMTASNFTYVERAYDVAGPGTFCGHMELDRVYFVTSCPTVKLWREELERLNAAGTPLTLYYELAEPVVTDLPTRLDKFIPVEPNGHLVAVTNTGEEVPLDVEFTVINENAGSGGGGGVSIETVHVPSLSSPTNSSAEYDLFDGLDACFPDGTLTEVYIPYIGTGNLKLYFYDRNGTHVIQPQSGTVMYVDRRVSGSCAAWADHCPMETFDVEGDVMGGIPKLSFKLALWVSTNSSTESFGLVLKRYS